MTIIEYLRIGEALHKTGWRVDESNELAPDPDLYVGSRSAVCAGADTLRSVPVLTDTREPFAECDREPTKLFDTR